MGEVYRARDSKLGASIRDTQYLNTLPRRFKRPMSFEFWRRQMRLMKGIELLVARGSARTIAAEAELFRQPLSFYILQSLKFVD